MNVLFLIVYQVILPVFALIGVGAFLHRKFSFDMNTLSKITTYFLLPAVSFVNIYESKMNGQTFIGILGFLILQNLCLIVVSTAIAKVAKFDRALSATFENSVVLNNSGNFGLPVSQLVFHANPLGASIQVVVSIFQNLLTYTYGLMNAMSVKSKGTSAVREMVKNPVIYAFLLGLVMNHFHLQLPSVLWKPVENAADAFLAIALVTLGAQSAFLRFEGISLPLFLSLVGRLLLSPLIAVCIIFVLGLEGTTAQALLIASSFPSSRNSALFALEYDNHPEYAAQTVLLSTMLCSITVTIVVYCAQMFY
ncbi:AEC family transporter [Brevibacillus migulae]|uniref:AEC family transporter n=1 Tax=Brevibacillus migulae TaxID=1644114 RepID=UPI00106E594F|nr:AEC family transporter [Brevibacillus migulae]